MPESTYILTEGEGRQPKVMLFAPDGARAEIYLHGAHVTSWVPVGGDEQLFLSPLSQFSPRTSIRGGVPVIFPQFSGEGPLPKHGFARKQDWQFIDAVVANDGVEARFQVGDDESTRAIWAHKFLTEVKVWVGGTRLQVTLNVTNVDASPFQFTAALHTYFGVKDISDAAVEGLIGSPYLDTVGQRVNRLQDEQLLIFTREVDRIYTNAPRQLVLQESNRRLTIKSGGFSDAVVWNPWAELSAALPDMEPDGYRRMLCIEAAVVGRPIELDPGQHWSGYQRIEVRKE
jgi:glucose-6-phosphate 1-epimerase